MKKISTLAIAVIVIALILVSQIFYQVDQTESALVIQLGKPVKVVTTPGLNVKTPFMQKVVYFDNRLLLYDATPSAIITKDKKNLVVDNYAKWRIVDPLKYYQTVRNETGAQSRLDDIIFSNLREELGKQNLFDIVAKTRASLMKIVTQNTNKASLAFGIEVRDVLIKRADLPPENERAVFERMRAERRREAKRYRSEGEERALGIRAKADREKTVILSEANRKSQVFKGEGDAVATRLYATAYNKDPKFFYFLKTMEAYKKALGANDTLILTPKSEFFRYMQKSE
ncbi:MAG: protease modulator HflC [Thermodesulfobacteriota bacterium]|nr:MAG: protease modulator HflC [Thermodesulfobacteriota bacterium]